MKFQNKSSKKKISDKRTDNKINKSLFFKKSYSHNCSFKEQSTGDSDTFPKINQLKRKNTCVSSRKKK